MNLHRKLEICSVFLFLIGLAFLVNKALPLFVVSLAEKPWMSSAYLILSLGTGYIFADFLSGMVHFLCDNFGDEETAYFGPAFIQPFRMHHTDPSDITKHDFFETNGNTCLVVLPVMGIYYFVSDGLSVWVSFSFLFSVTSVVFTNQFHKWAHLENPPRWIRVLQISGMILPKTMHSLHHTPPFSSYYCITCGWLNPLFEFVKFFPKMKTSIESVLIANRQK
ncbi:fatty acid desaturase CarF family protein [Leptospira ilyithenensis]|uniref:Kua-ubiquitin conjugating enzyme hybrid localization domain protein n=1 Tax=Leptospira ilyithenensis TaxID=2484901 RepID=A0A4V3JWQ6_9LEPT|nr:fatty acid desaturase CarF family protein [Leptospira ilyithenensis]TGN07109.1 kua-ubiquitin conjugating enzyme hybrid localization domain protein [Leptospira ilyithenensis]